MDTFPCMVRVGRAGGESMEGGVGWGGVDVRPRNCLYQMCNFLLKPSPLLKLCQKNKVGRYERAWCTRPSLPCPLSASHQLCHGQLHHRPLLLDGFVQMIGKKQSNEKVNSYSTPDMI